MEFLTGNLSGDEKHLVKVFEGDLRVIQYETFKLKVFSNVFFYYGAWSAAMMQIFYREMYTVSVEQFKKPTSVEEHSLGVLDLRGMNGDIDGRCEKHSQNDNY
jgi:hypothetical protein